MDAIKVEPVYMNMQYLRSNSGPSTIRRNIVNFSIFHMYIYSKMMY